MSRVSGTSSPSQPIPSDDARRARARQLRAQLATLTERFARPLTAEDYPRLGRRLTPPLLALYDTLFATGLANGPALPIRYCDDAASVALRRDSRIAVLRLADVPAEAQARLLRTSADGLDATQPLQYLPPLRQIAVLPKVMEAEGFTADDSSRSLFEEIVHQRLDQRFDLVRAGLTFHTLYARASLEQRGLVVAPAGRPPIDGARIRASRDALHRWGEGEAQFHCASLRDAGFFPGVSPVHLRAWSTAVLESLLGKPPDADPVLVPYVQGYAGYRLALEAGLVEAFQRRPWKATLFLQDGGSVLLRPRAGTDLAALSAEIARVADLRRALDERIARYQPLRPVRCEILPTRDPTLGAFVV